MTATAAEKKKIALVTGSNRGIGFFVTCRQLARLGISVILTCCSRYISKGEKAAKKQLSDRGLDVVFYQLDVYRIKVILIVYYIGTTNNATIYTIDVLVNNVAILTNTWHNMTSVQTWKSRESSNNDN